MSSSIRRFDLFAADLQPTTSLPQNRFLVRFKLFQLDWCHLAAPLTVSFISECLHFPPPTLCRSRQPNRSKFETTAKLTRDTISLAEVDVCGGKSIRVLGYATVLESVCSGINNVRMCHQSRDPVMSFFLMNGRRGGDPFPPPSYFHRKLTAEEHHVT